MCLDSAPRSRKRLKVFKIVLNIKIIKMLSQRIKVIVPDGGPVSEFSFEFGRC